MWGFGIFVALSITGMIVLEYRKVSRETYAAWCKAANVNITYEEWRRLQVAGLLPGQPKTSTVVVPVITQHDRY